METKCNDCGKPRAAEADTSCECVTGCCSRCSALCWGEWTMQPCVTMDDLRRELAALRDKARRFKGWRIRWQQGDGGEPFTTLTALRWAKHTAKGMRRNPKKYRNVRIVRVYRARKEG